MAELLIDKRLAVDSICWQCKHLFTCQEYQRWFAYLPPGKSFYVGGCPDFDKSPKKVNPYVATGLVEGELYYDS